MMYKISFLVPTTHVETVKTAMFNQGAGVIGHYKHCAWQVLGEGQFMPDEKARPFIGKKDEITRAPEYYVHMVCTDEVINSVIAALKEAHPYEEPAFDVVKIETF